MTRIDGSGGLGKAAIEAALKRHAEARATMADKVGGLTNPAAQAAPSSTSFAEKLGEGLNEVNKAVKAADGMEVRLLKGEVTELHEVAAQLKQADLTYKFALEVRNKLIDAYRETMRMSV